MYISFVLTNALVCMHCDGTGRAESAEDENVRTQEPCCECKGFRRYVRCETCGDVITIDEKERGNGDCLSCRVERESRNVQAAS